MTILVFRLFWIFGKHLHFGGHRRSVGIAGSIFYWGRWEVGEGSKTGYTARVCEDTEIARGESLSHIILLIVIICIARYPTSGIRDLSLVFSLFSSPQRQCRPNCGGGRHLLYSGAVSRRGVCLCLPSQGERDPALFSFPPINSADERPYCKGLHICETWDFRVWYRAKNRPWGVPLACN